MNRIVVKLGGSQLIDPQFCKRLADWLGATGDNEYFIIVGGGKAIDAMRELDRLHQLDEAAMHWRCVWMLKATTDIVQELLGPLTLNTGLRRISTPQEFRQAMTSRSGASCITLVDSSAFYFKGSGDPSPILTKISPPKEGWCTTTDALAIYCAGLLQADLCILLKSCPIADNLSIAEAARQGIVDPESISMAMQFPKVQLQQL